jgi:chromosome segregation ATPase
MRNLFIGLILIGGLGTALWFGCNGTAARVGVAKDNVIKQIDKVLGELNVKRKEVQIAFDKIEDAYHGLREKRIEAKILNDRFAKDTIELEKSHDVLRDNLEKLKPLLEEAQASGKVERNGKEVSIGELKALATKTINEMKRNQELLAHKKRMANIATANLKTLTANEATSKTQLERLRSDLEEIDSKKDMLDSMKTDTSLFTGTGTSINDEFEKLSKDVQSLMDKVDTQVAVEEAKLEDRISDIEATPATVEELFKDDTDVSGTISEIDAMLKGGNQ